MSLDTNEIECGESVRIRGWYDLSVQGEPFQCIPASFYKALKKEGAFSLSVELFMPLFKQVEIKCAKAYAIYLLSRRSFFTNELRKKLEDRSFSSHAVDLATAACKEMGALSDEDRLNTLVKKMLQKGKAPAFIKGYLKRYQLDSDLVEQMLCQSGYDAKEAILALIKKRGSKAFSNDPIQKKKEIHFLLRRGFSLEDILSALSKR